MKVQPKSYLSMLLFRIGAALFLTPLTVQALTGPDLMVTKTCAVNGPQSVLCTVTVKNIGQVPSVAPLTFTDTPTAPAGSTYTGAGSNSGLPISCSLGAGPVLPIPCTANKSLQPNETADALFIFRMPVPMCGTFTNVVTVTQGSNVATLPDPNPANNTNISTTLNLGPPCGDSTGDDKKTTICHNGQTISIATSALTAHIPGHPGDYLGACVQTGRLTVIKTLSPSTDPGKFNLLIDAATAGTGANVGNGGTTGAIVKPAGNHIVSETAATGTSLSNYTSVISGTGCAPSGAVTLAAGDNITCTITNTRNVVGPSPVILSNYPMQGGNQNTPCPTLGVVLPRSPAPPYLTIMLPNLDMVCSTKGPGFKLQSIKFLTCAPDSRGPGFGPNATADLTCGP